MHRKIDRWLEAETDIQTQRYRRDKYECVDIDSGIDIDTDVDAYVARVRYRCM